jgi:hypothetical protein
MELFDEDLGEVESEGVRYGFRRNPQRADEISASRADKLKHLQDLLDKQNAYLAGHGRAKIEIAVGKLRHMPRS